MAKQPTKPIDRTVVPLHKIKKSKAAAADNPHLIDADSSRLSDNIPDE
jgi:hypothetical protein